MTPILAKLDELKALCERGTKGEWNWIAASPSAARVWADDGPVINEKIYIGDAEFICASRIAMPQLVEIAELAAGLKCLCTGDDHDCQACFLRERIQAILEGKCQA